MAEKKFYRGKCTQVGAWKIDRVLDKWLEFQIINEIY